MVIKNASSQRSLVYIKVPTIADIGSPIGFCFEFPQKCKVKFLLESSRKETELGTWYFKYKQIQVEMCEAIFIYYKGQNPKYFSFDLQSI